MTRADWDLILKQRREVDAFRVQQQQRDWRIYDPLLSAWVHSDGRVVSAHKSVRVFQPFLDASKPQTDLTRLTYREVVA
ncbi:hypothetical protein M0R72_12655 [Candidatus Pacearchaeota archaeon]|jgi:hypothetical protein|nr:hypothetical protein [Candidatus Pacearchaeota archaeon]